MINVAVDYICYFLFNIPTRIGTANQGLATLSFFGVAVNLVLFLTRVLNQESADAANSVSKWTGTVYLFSLVGAFLSDSYWGRYLTCAVFQLILVAVTYIHDIYIL
ncbi:hypothetical protein CIPAW_13G169800 [Carya illinoinensis]|uniref:Uncharacterized protein n=1 Tax=Carya illinoinensis TaxID=32201 RepID=A0A8T1NKS3_CARIL|nr:hypothetical protein CIPAW_13G169800 [Carya illinoinensis]